MNTTDETQAAPPALYQRAFRQWVALIVAATVLGTVGYVLMAVVRDDVSGTDLIGEAGFGLLNTLGMVSAASILVMIFSPGLARKTGLPAFAGDERERRIFLHALGYGFITGLFSVLVYGFLTDDRVVSIIGLVMQVTFFVAMVWLNRRD